jgi:hypothetical protein
VRAALGSPAHREACSAAVPRFRGDWKRYRRSYFDRFRLLKLAYLVTRRGFPRRFWNLLVFLVERGRVARVHYFPVVMMVDPIDSCNLRCPGCTTGAATSGSRGKGRATLAFMERSAG